MTSGSPLSSSADQAIRDAAAKAESSPATAPSAEDAPGRPPAWRVLLAPWTSVFSPAAAARDLIAASRAALVATVAMSILLLCAIFVGLFLLNETVTDVWTPTARSTGRPELSVRTVSEVWRQWHARSWFAFPEELALLVIFLSALGVCILAWLNLPAIHTSGRISASLSRCFRAVTVVFGPLTFSVALFGLIIVGLEHRSARLAVGQPLRSPRLFGVESELVLLIAIPAALIGIFTCLSRAVRAARAGLQLPDEVPTCEGCGYDLTHQPDDRRCPECGLNIDVSLTPGLKRSMTPWDRGRRWDNWLATVVEVLRRPRAFYSHLRVRTDEQASEAFARWNFLALWIGSYVGAIVVLVIGTLRFGSSPGMLDEVFFVVVAFGLITALGLWLGHRIIAAGVTTWWLLSNALPDYSRVRKVIAYESVYLWTFCVFWGAMVISFTLFDQWITQIVRFPRIFLTSIPSEFVAVVLGTVAIGLIWLRRYALALRGIRWANF